MKIQCFLYVSKGNVLRMFHIPFNFYGAFMKVHDLNLNGLFLSIHLKCLWKYL